MRRAGASPVMTGFQRRRGGIDSPERREPYIIVTIVAEWAKILAPHSRFVNCVPSGARARE